MERSVLVVGGSGVLGRQILDHLNSNMLNYSYTYNNSSDTYSSVFLNHSIHIDLLNSDYDKPFDCLSNSVLDIIWCVAPSLAYKSFSRWSSQVCLSDNLELDMFRNFLRFLNCSKIKIGSLHLVLSEALLDSYQQRGLWGYVADKFFIRQISQELHKQKKIDCLYTYYPPMFRSKCSSELLRFNNVSSIESDKIVKKYASKIISNIHTSSCN